MTTPMEPQASRPDANPSADELQADIERTLEQLEQTVDALSEKLDVRAQTRHKVESLKQGGAAKVGAVRACGVQGAGRARDVCTDERGRPTAVALAGGALVSVLIAGGAVVMRRGRR